MSDIYLNQSDSNRLNSQKSTGPRSIVGKRNASRNAIRHGLFSPRMVLPGERYEAYEALGQMILRSVNPRDFLELQLATRITAACWRLRRAEAAEELMFITREVEASAELDQENLSGPPEGTPLPAEAILGVMMMDIKQSPIERLQGYEQRIERTIHRCLRELRLLRKDHEEAPEISTFLKKMLEEAGDVYETGATENGKTKPKQNRSQALDEPSDAEKKLVNEWLAKNRRSQRKAVGSAKPQAAGL